MTSWIWQDANEIVQLLYTGNHYEAIVKATSKELQAARTNLYIGNKSQSEEWKQNRKEKNREVQKRRRKRIADETLTNDISYKERKQNKI